MKIKVKVAKQEQLENLKKEYFYYWDKDRETTPFIFVPYNSFHDPNLSKLWFLLYVIKNENILREVENILGCKLLKTEGLREYAYDINYGIDPGYISNKVDIAFSSEHLDPRFFTSQVQIEIGFKGTYFNIAIEYGSSLNEDLPKGNTLLLSPLLLQKYTSLEEKLSLLLFSNIGSKIKQQYVNWVESKGKILYYSTKENPFFIDNLDEAMRGHYDTILASSDIIEVIEK